MVTERVFVHEWWLGDQRTSVEVGEPVRLGCVAIYTQEIEYLRTIFTPEMLGTIGYKPIEMWDPDKTVYLAGRCRSIQLLACSYSGGRAMPCSGTSLPVARAAVVTGEWDEARIPLAFLIDVST